MESFTQGAMADPKQSTQLPTNIRLDFNCFWVIKVQSFNELRFLYNTSVEEKITSQYTNLHSVSPSKWTLDRRSMIVT